MTDTVAQSPQSTPQSKDKSQHPNKKLVTCKWRRLATTGDVPPARSSCAAGVVGNKLIIFSGEQIQRIPVDGHVYVLDLSKNQSTNPTDEIASNQVEDQSTNEPLHHWYCIPERSESWPLPRVGPASTVTSDKLLLYGGRIGKDLGDQSLGDFWQLDISLVNQIINQAKKSKQETNTDAAAEETIDETVDQSSDLSVHLWTPLPIQGTPPPPLSYACMVASKDLVYVLNGATVSHGLTNDIWFYDFNKQEWDQETFKEMFDTPQSKRACPSKRTGSAGIYSDDGLHVMFGLDGKEELADHWIWDFECRNWDRYEKAPILPPARSVSPAVFLPKIGKKGSIWVCCGKSSPSENSDLSSEFHHDCWLFDVATKTWHQLEMGDNAPNARGWFNACALEDGQSVILFGGYDGKQRYNDVYIWSVADD